jgi:hypothetical protein
MMTFSPYFVEGNGGIQKLKPLPGDSNSFIGKRYLKRVYITIYQRVSQSKHLIFGRMDGRTNQQAGRQSVRQTDRQTGHTNFLDML